MFFLPTCNIDKTDRINRSIIGLFLCLSALFDWSRTFYMILGLILLIEGLVGWCSIPYLLDKIKQKFSRTD